MARDQRRVKPRFLRLPDTYGPSLNIFRRPLALLTPLPASDGGPPIVCLELRGDHWTPNNPQGGAHPEQRI